MTPNETLAVLMQQLSNHDGYGRWSQTLGICSCRKRGNTRTPLTEIGMGYQGVKPKTGRHFLWWFPQIRSHIVWMLPTVNRLAQSPTRNQDSLRLPRGRSRYLVARSIFLLHGAGGINKFSSPPSHARSTCDLSRSLGYDSGLG